MEAKHSNLGIASFALSLAVGFLLLAVIIAAGIISTQHVALAQGEITQVSIGFVIIALLAADLAAVGLGIAGVCQRGRKRLFGILGLCFSTAVILLTVGLLVFGVSADK